MIAKTIRFQTVRETRIGVGGRAGEIRAGFRSDGRSSDSRRFVFPASVMARQVMLAGASSTVPARTCSPSRQGVRRWCPISALAHALADACQGRSSRPRAPLRRRRRRPGLARGRTRSLWLGRVDGVAGTGNRRPARRIACGKAVARIRLDRVGWPALGGTGPPPSRACSLGQGLLSCAWSRVTTLLLHSARVNTPTTEHQAEPGRGASSTPADWVACEYPFGRGRAILPAVLRLCLGGTPAYASPRSRPTWKPSDGGRGKSPRCAQPI
jgi:hypothetical protein